MNPKETRIYLFVIHDRNNKVKIKTEYTIKPIKWDFDQQRVKPQVSGSIPINDRLSLLNESIKNEYNQIRKDNPEKKFPEIAENFKAFVKNKISPVYQQDNIFIVLDKYLEVRSHELSELTIKKFRTLKSSLENFEPELTFDKIDRDFFDRYIRHLRELPAKQSRQKNRPKGMQDGLLSDAG